ncbi:MAG: hypothetical protein ACK5VI_10530 [Opitutia bacterium]
MSEHDLDPRFVAALRARRAIPVEGFAERAVLAARRDRRRRNVIRWAGLAAPLAACLALVLAPAAGQPAGEAELEHLAALVGELEVGVPHLDDSEGLARLAAWGS